MRGTILFAYDSDAEDIAVESGGPYITLSQFSAHVGTLPASAIGSMLFARVSSRLIVWFIGLDWVRKRGNRTRSAPDKASRREPSPLRSIIWRLQ